MTWRIRALRSLCLFVLGGVGALGYAPFGLWPLTALALVGLLWVVQPLSPWRTFAAVFVFQLGHFVAGIYWIYISTVYYGNAPPLLGVVLVLLLSSFLATYAAAGLALARALARTPLTWVVLAAAVWAAAELLRGILLGGFPWLAPGYTLTDTVFVRFAPLMGVHAMSGVLLLVCGLVAVALRDARRRNSLTAACVSAGVLGAALLLPPPSAWTTPVGGPLHAALVQGNVAQVDKWQPDKRADIAQQYRQATLEALASPEPLDVIVWPEVAVPYTYDQLQGSYLSDLERALAERDVALLFGTLIPNADRTQMINSVAGAGATGGIYYKRHLVPFGEAFPLPDFMRPLLDVMDLKFADLDTGEEGQPKFVVAGQPVSVSICFEDVFGDEIAREARGTGLLVNVTNDAWFHDSSAGPQHLQIARMRSAETARPMLKVAQTGITALIGANGQIVERLPFEVADTLRVQVQPRSGVTPYMRRQDRLIWLVAGLILCWVIGSAVYPKIRDNVKH